MWVKSMTRTALLCSLASAAILGCESLPGDEKSQGAVIGGVGGALAGAAVAGDDDRLVGALIGGALGAGGGYLIGSEVDKRNDDKTREEAIKASEQGQSNPATAEAAANAKTADVNADGFVTLDEVVAMEKAGLKDREMVDRLRRTQQVFHLNASQEKYLRDHGVTDTVITAMREMNRDTGNASLASESKGSERIGSRTSD